MRAAVLTQLNQPLEIEELELPLLGVGQVLVQVVYSTICGAQLGEIHGAKGPDPFLPHLMGHEGCGRVLEVGPGVRYVKVGDTVVMHWRKGVGIESGFPKYRRKDGTFAGGGLITTFCELAVVSENRLTAVPSNIPPKVISLMGCAVTTAFGLINNEAKLKLGQSIAVAGVGGVGLSIVQGAFLVGAYPIIAIDLFENKLDQARLLGASHIINGTGAEFSDEIYKIAGKNGVDVFVDCTGSPGVIADGYKVTAAGGIMILVGQPHDGASVVFGNMQRHYCGKTLLDSQGGLTNPTIDIPRYIRMYDAGLIDLETIVTHSFPLEQINKAIAVVRSGSAGRVGLEMNHG